MLWLVAYPEPVGSLNCEEAAHTCVTGALLLFELGFFVCVFQHLCVCVCMCACTPCSHQQVGKVFFQGGSVGLSLLEAALLVSTSSRQLGFTESSLQLD